MFFSNLSLSALSILSIVSGNLPQFASADDVPSNLRGLASTEEKTYIVSFTDKDVSPAKRCAALAKANGGTVGYIYSNVLNGCSITVPVAQFQAQSVLTALSSRPEVKLVNEDQMMYISQPNIIDTNIFSTLSASQSVAAKSWGLDRVDQCALPLNSLATKQDASGVRVFILDTGVRNTHQEFTGMINSANSCHYSAISNSYTLSSTSDGNGHG